MLPLVLALSLAQLEPAAPTASSAGPPPADGPAADRPLAEPLPLVPSPSAVPPDAPLPPRPPQATPPSATARVAVSALGAVGGSAAGLGISLLYGGANPRIDATFANAMLSSLLIAGVGLTVHQAMSGRGEVTLAMLVSIVLMAGAAVAASALDATYPTALLLTSAIGTVPAALATAFALEGTQPRLRLKPRPAPMPGGGGGFVLSGEF